LAARNGACTSPHPPCKLALTTFGALWFGVFGRKAAGRLFRPALPALADLVRRSATSRSLQPERGAPRLAQLFGEDAGVAPSAGILASSTYTQLETRGRQIEGWARAGRC
jgi:hypothetical protein